MEYTVRREIESRRHALAEAVVARQYALQPELWKPYGDEGREKSVRDVDYHLSYLVEAIDTGDPSLFVDYVAWVKVLFAGLGFPEQVLPTTLTYMRYALHEHLSAQATETAARYLEAALDHLQEGTITPPTFIQEDGPAIELARRYLEALLQNERRVASQLILEAVEGGLTVKQIYLHVFQPVQYEIGRLWQTNQISVAQEHYCTAATQLIMSQLYPRIFATAKIGRRLVAACVGGELHEIGVRMVADFFEMEGWDTYYLGANTPASSIVRTVREQEADIVGISATMTFHIADVERLIEQVRASEVGQAVKILVGGYPFKVAPELWRRVGADGFARDAQEAVARANRLIAQGT